MKRHPMIPLAAFAFVILTAAGASRYVNGTEIPNAVTLLYSSGSQAATLGAVTASSVAVSGAVSVTGAVTLNNAAITFGSLAAGVTAATGSAQGDGAMTTFATQVSTSASAGDAVTLIAAAAGRVALVCNRAAANAIDVFPAASDAINKETANTAISLAAGECMYCLAFDAVQWGCVIGSAT